MSRRLVVTTWHVEPPREVEVILYRNAQSMRRACRRSDTTMTFSHALGACHQWRGGPIVVRLIEDRLTLRVLAHELLHAALAVYGETMTTELAADVLTAWNEDIAHLYDDLLTSVLRALPTLPLDD